MDYINFYHPVLILARFLIIEWQNRTGVENDSDKGYITHVALYAANGALEEMTKNFKNIFDSAILKDNLLHKNWIVTSNIPTDIEKD